MARFDSFFCAQDVHGPTPVYAEGTLQSSATIAPEGTLLQLASGQAAGFPVDVRVHAEISQAGKPTLLGWITKRDTVAHTVIFRPINQRRTQDFDAGVQYTSGAIVRTRAIFPVSLPIDLTEAPAGTYRYLVIGEGSVLTNQSGRAAKLKLRTNAEAFHNPWAAVGVDKGLAQVTTQQADQRIQFVQAHSLSVTPGTVREIYWSAEWGSQISGFSLGCDHARLIALRIDQCPVFVETGDGIAAVSTTNGAGADVATLTAPSAGEYVCAITGALGSSVGGRVICEVLHKNSGGTTLGTYAVNDLDPQNSTDREPWGTVLHIASMSAGDKIVVRLYATGGGTVFCDRLYGALFTKPPYMRSVQSTKLGSEVEALPATFGELRSAGVTLPNTGRYVELIAASVGTSSSTRILARPRFSADTAGFYTGTVAPRSALDFPSVTARSRASFFFQREKRAAGLATNYLDGKQGNAGNVLTDYVSFLWIGLEDGIAVTADGEWVVAAKIEAARNYKTWQPAGPSDVFQKQIPDVVRLSGVRRNGTDMTLVSGVPANVGEYSWDEATHTVKVKLPSGKTPGDSDETILVVTLLHAADGDLVLEEPDGSSQPYEWRLESTPTFRRGLRVDERGASSSESLGEIGVAAADGRFDKTALRQIYQGLRATFLVGPKNGSRKERDWIPYLTATCGTQFVDQDVLRLPLYGSFIELAKPLSEATFSIYQGSIQRTGQLAPIVRGHVSRVVAYRTTNDESSAMAWNTFKVSHLPLESIPKVYLDGTTGVAISGAYVDATAANLANGEVKIKNEAFDPDGVGSQSFLPLHDTVFCEVYGTPEDNTQTGRTLRLPGEIALTIYRQGLPSSLIDVQSFVDLDRIWRYRLKSGRPVPIAPAVGFYSDRTISIAAAARSVLAYAFAEPIINHAGRIAAAVLDFHALNLTLNPGFEEDGSSIWPWTVAGGSASASIGTSTTYHGQRAIQVSSGGSADAALIQPISIRKGKQNVLLTPVVGLQTGAAAKCRLSVVRPGNGLDEELSDPLEVSQTEWRRLEHYLELDEDEVGTTLVKVFPAHGDTMATSIFVDDFEAWPIYAAVDENNRKTDVLGEIDEAAFFQARVEVDTNYQADTDPAVILNDGDLQGVLTGLSIARYAMPGSGRVDPGRDVIIADAESSAGTAAAYLQLYSEPRQAQRFDLQGRIGHPIVTDLIYDRALRRLESADSFPVYAIREVSAEEINESAITAERQIPIVADQAEIAPTAIPLGMILFGVGTSCPADWTEVTNLADAWLAIVGAGEGADPVTLRGAWRHDHELPHDHVLDDHDHTCNATLGASDQSWQIQTAFGPTENVARGPSAGDHSHSGSFAGMRSGRVKSNPKKTNQPTTTLRTNKGSNVPNRTLRVIACKRTAAAVSTFPTTLFFGVETASAPSGFARDSALENATLRVRSANTSALATTTSGAHTPGTDTAVFPALSTSGVAVNRIVKVEKADLSAHYYGVVTGVVGSNVTVEVLHLNGDTVGISYASGSTITAPSDQAGTLQQYGDGTHNHGSVPSHLHQAPHAHDDKSTAENRASGGVTAGTIASFVEPMGGQDIGLSLPTHPHLVWATIPETTEATQAAAGSVTSTSEAKHDQLRLPWVKANAGVTSAAVGLIGFVDGLTCPPGWEAYHTGPGAILAAAASAQPASIDGGGHVHSASFAAHSVPHTHGGSQQTMSDGTSPSFSKSQNDVTGDNSGAFGGILAGGGQQGTLGHRHQVTLGSIQNVSPNAQASTGTSSSAAAGAARPPYRTLLACRKT